jgi:hypothetical protein
MSGQSLKAAGSLLVLPQFGFVSGFLLHSVKGHGTQGSQDSVIGWAGLRGIRHRGVDFDREPMPFALGSQQFALDA